MKYIRKNIEPPDFINWKNQQKSLGVNFNYKSFQHPQKKIVKESLLREQGYICCYCCRKINQENSHIEHFLPQSKTDDNLALDYHNMLSSCGPYDIQEQKEQEKLDQKKQVWPEHCGNVRKNTSLPISPLDMDCETYFAYTQMGEIIPSYREDHLKKAENTISLLSLNNAELRLKRLGVLEGILDGIEDLTIEEAQQLLKYYQNFDKNGHYQSFCVAIIYFLKQYFNIN